MWRLLWLFPILLSWAAPAAMAQGEGLVDLQGRSRGLSDYTGKGQWTVVMIWASTCGVCRHDAPDVEAFYRRHKDDRAQVLGLSADSRANMADAQGFVADYGLTFPNLVGDPEDVAALFYDMTGNNLTGTPAFLVFDPTGRLRTYQMGRMEIALLETFMQQQQISAAEAAE